MRCRTSTWTSCGCGAQVLIHGGVLGGGADSVTSSRTPSPARRRRISPARTTGRGACSPSSGARATEAWLASRRSRTSISRRGTPRPARIRLDRDPVAAGRAGGRHLHRLLQGRRQLAPIRTWSSDPGLANANNPFRNGETPNDPNRIGRMIRVIKGTSRGKSAKIVSNTATQLHARPRAAHRRDQRLDRGRSRLGLFEGCGGGQRRPIEDHVSSHRDQ